MFKFLGREHKHRDSVGLEIPGLVEINEELKQLRELADALFYNIPLSQRKVADVEPINQRISDLLKKRDEIIKIHNNLRADKELLNIEQSFVTEHQLDLERIRDQENQTSRQFGPDIGDK